MGILKRKIKHRHRKAIQTDPKRNREKRERDRERERERDRKLTNLFVRLYYTIHRSTFGRISNVTSRWRRRIPLPLHPPVWRWWWFGTVCGFDLCAPSVAPGCNFMVAIRWKRRTFEQIQQQQKHAVPDGPCPPAMQETETTADDPDEREREREREQRNKANNLILKTPVFLIPSAWIVQRVFRPVGMHIATAFHYTSPLCMQMQTGKREKRSIWEWQNKNRFSHLFRGAKGKQKPKLQQWRLVSCLVRAWSEKRAWERAHGATVVPRPWTLSPVELTKSLPFHQKWLLFSSLSSNGRGNICVREKICENVSLKLICSDEIII